MLAMVFLHSLMAFGLFRVGKERLGRRETLVHLELLDQPASAGPSGTTAPRETLYVSSTTHKTVTTDSVWYTISRLTLTLIRLQGPVGFPGDHGPPGEPGAAVSDWSLSGSEDEIRASSLFTAASWTISMILYVVFGLFRVLMVYQVTKEMMERLDSL